MSELSQGSPLYNPLWSPDFTALSSLKQFSRQISVQILAFRCTKMCHRALMLHFHAHKSIIQPEINGTLLI